MQPRSSSGLAQESRNGFAKPAPAGDVQTFSEQHVAAPALAKLLKLDFRSLSRFLKEACAPVLAVPVIGKGQTSLASHRF